MIRGIGINCDDGSIDGHLDRLKQQLERAQRAGFNAYELTIEACNVIRGGRVNQAELDKVKEILASYPLRYTAHPPCSMRLTDPSGRHRQVFLSCLDVVSQIGGEVMVYHSAQMALRNVVQEIAPLLSEADLQDMWRVETAELKEMAKHAADKGITIAVENRDPHRWELAALYQHGKPASELIHYHQGMRLDLLARQMEEVGSANVGICLDVGHAFLAAPYWPQPDYLAGVRVAAPWIKHVHMHDNFGRLDDFATTTRERLAFGEADNHMPPGWGAIPLPGVVAALKKAGYAGWYLVEIDGRYHDLLPDVIAQARALVS